MRQLLLFLCVVFISTGSTAQDALFSQYYHSPLYLNPAFSGCGKNNLRLSGSSKLQWLNLNQSYKFITGAADLSVYDDYLRNVCNIGGLVTHSSKGFLQTTNVSGIVGRSFGTGNENCSNWFLSLALQAGYTFNRVNNNYLIFADQIDQNGITDDPSQVDIFTNGNTAKNYFDMSSGFIFTVSNFMIGGAVHHLNEPEQSFKGASVNSKLPKKVTAHFSYVYDNGNIKFKPTLIAGFQGQSKVLVAGALFDFNEFPIEIGLWYRNNTGFSNNHAFSIGFNWKFQSTKMVTTNSYEYTTKFGLCYDAEAYKPAVNTTHGSIELGFQKDIIINNDLKCPTATSGQCNYKFPWEFF